MDPAGQTDTPILPHIEAITLFVNIWEHHEAKQGEKKKNINQNFIYVEIKFLKDFDLRKAMFILSYYKYYCHLICLQIYKNHLYDYITRLSILVTL